jgi:hypothetical protein
VSERVRVVKSKATETTGGDSGQNAHLCARLRRGGGGGGGGAGALIMFESAPETIAATGSTAVGGGGAVAGSTVAAVARRFSLDIVARGTTTTAPGLGCPSTTLGYANCSTSETQASLVH